MGEESVQRQDNNVKNNLGKGLMRGDDVENKELNKPPEKFDFDVNDDKQLIARITRLYREVRRRERKRERREGRVRDRERCMGEEKK